MPFLTPGLKLLGVDTAALRDSLSEVDDFQKQIREMAAIPDIFNAFFAQRAWIIYDRMNLDVVKTAIKKAQDGDLDGAEEQLVEHYSVETIEWQLQAMWSVKAFQSRIPLAEKALDDYREERYHACVPVILALLDGMVNEIHYKKGLPARGFFAEGVELTAWNSVAGHNKGLGALVKILQTSRTSTNVDPIKIPYRNGILHGMDLNYGNKMVAAKTWAALFAIRDWAVKAEQGLLNEQPKAPEPTWPEIIKKLEENEKFKAQLSSWSPRNLSIGLNVPVNGDAEQYQLDSPERKLVEYLFFWKSKNFGRMGHLLSHLAKNTDNKTALMVRQLFEGRELQDFEIIHVEDEAPAITIIHVRIKEQEHGELKDRIVIARMINEDEMGQPMTHGAPKNEWRIIWYGLNHYLEESDVGTEV